MALTLCDHSELKQVNDNQQPRDAMTTLQTAVFDTKPYDRESLQRAASNGEIEWRFMDWRLSAETSASAKGARAICIFVNDRADRACLEALASRGVKHVALRCAGYNSVDIEAAWNFGHARSGVLALRSGGARSRFAPRTESQDSTREQSCSRFELFPQRSGWLRSPRQNSGD